MRKAGFVRDKKIERAVNDILKSRARSRIYIYLLAKNGARTEEIIKGTRLHPSTVRETLSKMHNNNQIYRKKIKNDSIGKNPYIFYPISPIKLIKRHAKEIEDKLNKIASLAFSREKENNYRPVEININEEGG
ncbi:MAG: TrmB family transcriptional regulator [Thermoplasmatales archaeon SG8-52-3]|nr:MAG: TrmB family transcriptional regulator [Thermoplasmatales archaeon SG8-52-3]